MALQNFIARRLPTISAVWLNMVDWFFQNGTDSGVANAYVVSLGVFNPLAPFTLSAGQIVRFIPNNTNTGLATVNVAGTGAKSVVNGVGLGLSGGEIVANYPVWLQYTGAVWILLAYSVTPDKQRTAGEIAAGITAINYNFGAEPILYGERYGFVGDGVTLNNTAMTAAINLVTQLGGGRLLLKKGTYLFSAGFSPPESMIIQGVGRLTTTLKANGNFTLVQIASTSGRVQLRDLTLQGTSKTGTGVQVGDTAHSGQHCLQNIRITGFFTGLRLAAALWTSVYDCLIDFNEIGVDYNAGSGTMYSNDIAFYSTTIQFNDRNGIAATSTPVRCIGLKFIGGSIEQNGSEAPATYPQVVLGSIAHCYFNTYIEYIAGGTKPDGFSISGTSHLEIAETYFLGTATAVKSSASGSSNVFIHHCDFNSTSTRCLDFPSCLQVLALHNEYDLTNNVINAASSKDATGQIVDQVVSSFTGTLNGGITTNPTAQIDYWVHNGVVTLYIPSLQATSNATTQPNITGMPAAIRPAALRSDVGVAVDNGNNVISRFIINTSGQIDIFNGVSTVFTNAGNKGSAINVLHYPIS